jgi:hypothetical protein
MNKNLEEVYSIIMIVAVISFFLGLFFDMYVLTGRNTPEQIADNIDVLIETEDIPYLKTLQKLSIKEATSMYLMAKNSGVGYQGKALIQQIGEKICYGKLDKKAIKEITMNETNNNFLRCTTECIDEK